MNFKEILLFIIILNNNFNLILNNIYNHLNNSDMKMITRTLTLKYLAGWLSLFFILFSLADIKAQANWMLPKIMDKVILQPLNQLLIMAITVIQSF